MEKKLFISVCMALVCVLCMGTLSAQERFNPNLLKGEVTQGVIFDDATSLTALFSERGTGSEVYYSNSSGSIRKGTAGSPFPGTSVGSNGSFLQCFEYIDGELYAIRWNSGNQLGKINMATGNLAAGSHTFSVEALYDDECTPKKVAAPALTIKTCGDAIEGVEVVYDADCKATVTWNSVAKTRDNVIYDNGPFITHPGGGYEGADASCVHPNSTSYGFGCALTATANTSIADDFILTEDVIINTIDFYAYQTGSTTTSTITGVRVCIWDGSPMSGGSVIWGNMTDNVMDGNLFSGIYRVASSEIATGTARPLMKVTADIGGLELAPGHYWVQFQMTGSLASGPFATPVVPAGAQTGDGLSYDGTTWSPFVNSNGSPIPHDIVFIVYGELGEPAAPKYNVYMDDALVAAAIEETAYTHPVAVSPGVDVEWCVTEACSNGDESEAGCATEKCGSCDKVTNAAVTLSETAAVLTWTAVEGATGYEISREGNVLATVTTTTYTEEGEFAPATEYKWQIVTLCGEGKSDAVEVGGFLGINDMELSKFTVIPNPAQEYIQVSAGVNFNKVEVINFLGQTVISQSVGAMSAQIDISNLTNGVYFVRIASENGVSVKKFVKQ
jgi:hypothetical protein